MQAAIGQSDSLFTPLQLAEYCAAVANGGERHSASILKSVRSYSYGDNVYGNARMRCSARSKPRNITGDAVHEGITGLSANRLPKLHA